MVDLDDVLVRVVHLIEGLFAIGDAVACVRMNFHLVSSLYFGRLARREALLAIERLLCFDSDSREIERGRSQRDRSSALFR